MRLEESNSRVSTKYKAKRERMVKSLRLAIDGLTVKEIAIELKIDPRTVGRYFKNFGTSHPKIRKEHPSLNQKQIVALRILGHSHKYIAKALHINENASRQRLWRARKALRGDL